MQWHKSKKEQKHRLSTCRTSLVDLIAKLFACHFIRFFGAGQTTARLATETSTTGRQATLAANSKSKKSWKKTVRRRIRIAKGTEKSKVAAEKLGEEKQAKAEIEAEKTKQSTDTNYDNQKLFHYTPKSKPVHTRPKKYIDKLLELGVPCESRPDHSTFRIQVCVCV